jgi:tetratricopeptide (TPR) repeat protein
MMAGTVNKTLEWLNRALDLNPGHYDSLKARALAYYARKEYNRMEIDASMMVGNRPTDSQGYALRAIARREKAIRKDENELLEEAIRDHNKAIQLADDQAELYDHRRRTHMQMGNFESAFADARTCVRLQPDEGLHNFHRCIGREVCFRHSQCRPIMASIAKQTGWPRFPGHARVQRDLPTIGQKG